MWIDLVLKVNSHDLEDSCIRNAIQNWATCFRSLFTTTFNNPKAVLLLNWGLHGCWSWGRDPAPGLGWCTERRELTGESHRGVRFDDSGCHDAACVGIPLTFFQRCVNRDVVWVRPQAELACRERWGSVDILILVRVKYQPREVPWSI